jgi:stage II sporulation protein D
VLLVGGARRLVVEPAGGREQVVEASGGALRAGGRRSGALGLAGPGPHRIEGRRYRGAIEVSAQPEGLRVVNEVPLEEYVAGTLLGEVHASWARESWGGAVLEAQAVAIRTYALHRRGQAGARAWDVEADTRGQVYLGQDGESDAAWRAVDATRGQVLTWNGEVILAAFHGTAGGRTASAAEVWGEPVPYLESVAVEGEEVSPDTYWRAPVSSAELETALAALGHEVGPIERIEIEGRTGSGRCETLRVRGADGTVQVPATALRRVLGERRLRSTLFEIRPAPDGVVFVGSGRGHGVGMSQWGARALAERGASARVILGRFYPGARLVALRSVPAARAAAGGSW